MIRRLFISVYEHPHGDVVKVHATEIEAQERKQRVARDYWKHVMDGEPPEDGQEAASRYFEAAEEQGEHFTIHAVDTGDLVFRVRPYWNPDDPWAIHERFSREAWAHEVGDDSTSLGYIDWVNSQIEELERESQSDEGDADGEDCPVPG